MALKPPDRRGSRPGCVNAHTHVYGALCPLGMPPPAPAPTSFLEILERIWWRLDRALDEATLRAAARLYAAEALLHGTTTLVDHHESPGFIEGSLDVIGDACQELGVRAALCFGATERNRGADEARRGLEECRRFQRANRRPLVRGLVGLHASFTVSDETLRAAGALARELGTVTHVHVAEDLADVTDARRRGHHGPLERLLALGALPRGSILAHGVHLEEPAVRAAADAGCWIVQNPRSNESNHVGYPRALWASDRVALGTDGFPADMRVELGALVRISRLHPESEPGAPAGVGRRLEAGRALAAERFAGAGGIEEDRVEADEAEGEGCRARRVIVAGQAVVEGGRLARADLDEIRAHAREAADRLWRRMEAV
jgi:cytosine/adenosine deaminase-related metal-dependent hydrolase